MSLTSLFRSMAAQQSFWEAYVDRRDCIEHQLPFAPCNIVTDGMRMVLRPTPERHHTSDIRGRYRAPLEKEAPPSVAALATAFPRDTGPYDRLAVGPRVRELVQDLRRQAAWEPFQKRPAARVPVQGWRFAHIGGSKVVHFSPSHMVPASDGFTPNLDARLLSPLLLPGPGYCWVLRDQYYARNPVLLEYPGVAWFMLVPILGGA